MNLLLFFIGYFNAIYDVREKAVWFLLYCLYSLCFRWCIVLMFDKEWIVFRICLVNFADNRILALPFIFHNWGNSSVCFVIENFEGNNWFIELPVHLLLWVWACFWWLWDVIIDVVVSFLFSFRFYYFVWLKWSLDDGLINVLMIFSLPNWVWVTLSALSDQRE